MKNKILKTKKEQMKGLKDKSLNQAVFPLLDKNPFRKFVPIEGQDLLIKDATGKVRELSKKTGPITTYGEVTEYRKGGKLNNYQTGGQPTYQDSMDLYNNSMRKLALYTKTIGKPPTEYQPWSGKGNRPTPKTGVNKSYQHEPITVNLGGIKRSYLDFGEMQAEHNYITIPPNKYMYNEAIDPEKKALWRPTVRFENLPFLHSSVGKGVTRHNIDDPGEDKSFFVIDGEQYTNYFSNDKAQSLRLNIYPKPVGGGDSSPSTTTSSTTTSSTTTSSTTPPKPYVPNYDTDLVAYLQKEKKPFNFAERKKLATEAGMTNYTGTAEQNIALLKSIQGKAEIPATLKTPLITTTNFEKRIDNPNLKINNQDGTFSTHKMMSFEADGKYYAAPTIIEKDGKLVELDPDAAVDHALKNKEYKEFKTEKEAQSYAEGAYKKGTKLEEPTTPTNTTNTTQPPVDTKVTVYQKGNNTSPYAEFTKVVFKDGVVRYKTFDPTLNKEIFLSEDSLNNNLQKYNTAGAFTVKTQGDTTKIKTFANGGSYDTKNKKGGMKDYQLGGPRINPVTGLQYESPTGPYNNNFDINNTSVPNFKFDFSGTSLERSGPDDGPIDIQSQSRGLDNIIPRKTDEQLLAESNSGDLVTLGTELSRTYNPYLPYIGGLNYGLNSLANLNRNRQALDTQNRNMQLIQSNPGVVYLNNRQQRGDDQMYAKYGGQKEDYQDGGPYEGQELELTEEEYNYYVSQGYEFE